MIHTYNTKEASITWLWYILFSGVMTDIIDGYLAKRNDGNTEVGWRDIFYDTKMLTAGGLYLLLLNYSFWLKLILFLLLMVTSFLGLKISYKTNKLEEKPGKNPPIRLGMFSNLEAIEMFGIIGSVTGYVIATKIVPNAFFPNIFLIPEAWLLLIGSTIGALRLPHTLFDKDGALRRIIYSGMSSGDEIKEYLSWLKKILR